MKDKSRFIKPAIVVIVLLAIVLLIINNKLELPELEAEDISEVYYTSDTYYEKKNLDIEEFLVYYNQIDGIRDNEEGAGTTPDKFIEIKLKNGDEISIVNSGHQFEVNFTDSEGDIKQYWGIQQEIYNMLMYGSYSLEN